MNTTLIKMVISTLNTVEVKGKENMGSLLGCIEALESFVQRAEQVPMGEQKEAEDG